MESGLFHVAGFVDYFRLLFAYNESMKGLKVTGHERGPDWPKLGPSVLIATVLVVAIRTVKWSLLPKEDCGGADIDHELDQEISNAMRVTMRVMRALLREHDCLFPQKLTPTWEPTGEDVPK